MDIPEIEEPTYGFILRSVFSYLKKIFGIDLDASVTLSALSGCTTTSLVVTANTNLLVDQIVRVGAEEVFITGVVTDATLNITTLTISPALTSAPVVSTSILVLLTVVPFDLQYAIFQHAKFIYEGQKKLTSIIDSVTDAVGNKATYKVKPPASIISAYYEYSPNELAFS
jgi:hypothetical protein